MYFISHLIFFLIFLNFDDMLYSCLSYTINITFFIIFMSIIAMLRLPVNIYIIINSIILFIFFKIIYHIVNRIKNNKQK